MSHYVWFSNAKSHVGSVRAANEDSYLDLPSAGLWCIADGMGGHERGEFASHLIIEKLDKLSEYSKPLNIKDIKDAIQEANTELFELSKSQSVIVGSTIVVLFIENNLAHVLWAGDSRVYMIRSEKMTQVTTDHTQAEELVRLGLLSVKNAEKHSGRNIITRAVGLQNSVLLEHKTIEFLAGDYFLLCSDGLNDALKDAEIERIFNKEAPHKVTDDLIEESLRGWARDNVTVISVFSQGF